MQKKHQFCLVLGDPTFGEGDLVGTKSQVFPKSSFEGSPYTEIPQDILISHKINLDLQELLRSHKNRDLTRFTEIS